MTRVYHRQGHPAGIAFAVAIAGTRSQHESLTFHKTTGTALPSPTDCDGEHVVIEHFAPTAPYIRMLAEHAKSVVLYPDEPIVHDQLGMPENVDIRYDEHPAFRRLLLENLHTPYPWMNADLSPATDIGLWLWGVTQGGTLPPTSDELRYIHRRLDDSEMLLRETHRVGTFANGLIDDQMAFCENVCVAGISGVAVNLPHHLLARAVHHIASNNLLIAYTVRRGAAVGIVRADKHMHMAIIAELVTHFGITAVVVNEPGTDNVLSFKTSLSKMSRLFSKGYTASMN